MAGRANFMNSKITRQFLAVARLRSIDHSQSRLLKIQSLKASHQSIASSPSSSSSAQP
ncbi:hypothetical protein PCANC_05632 [Puccinia coronata f. sp. avenae]|uniref:Uncharacterized protein n=1 Tax=Puccinia coronata f. sp. avenae TaxID=200324 RepID=A0A2N5VWT9_9BASI|nr:hypothetical protein PCASD_01755 [Puccinia coronata f. sp. avenae]PLW54467.1 hypothetical protein PCANC_05632 [Puccinia coronata f. sp. avenae]